jgi:hypothetical protein
MDLTRFVAPHTRIHPCPKELPTLLTSRVPSMVLIWNPTLWSANSTLLSRATRPDYRHRSCRQSHLLISHRILDILPQRHRTHRIRSRSTNHRRSHGPCRLNCLEESDINVTEMWRWLVDVGRLTDAFAIHDQFGRFALASKMATIYYRVAEAVLKCKAVVDAKQEILGDSSIALKSLPNSGIYQHHYSPPSPDRFAQTLSHSPYSLPRPKPAPHSSASATDSMDTPNSGQAA